MIFSELPHCVPPLCGGALWACPAVPLAALGRSAAGRVLGALNKQQDLGTHRLPNSSVQERQHTCFW